MKKLGPTVVKVYQELAFGPKQARRLGKDLEIQAGHLGHILRSLVELGYAKAELSGKNWQNKPVLEYMLTEQGMEMAPHYGIKLNGRGNESEEHLKA
jgi:DNA-binding HxlR family transcriptional regulator